MKFRGRGSRWKRKRQRARARLLREFERDMSEAVFRALTEGARAVITEECIRDEMLRRYPDIIPETIEITHNANGSVDVKARRRIRQVTITGVVKV